MHFRVDIVVGSNRNQCHFERRSANDAPEIIIALSVFPRVSHEFLRISKHSLHSRQRRIRPCVSPFSQKGLELRFDFSDSKPSERRRAFPLCNNTARRRGKGKKGRKEERIRQLPLILSLNRRNDASAAIQCETIKISRSGAELGTPCHKFQQILIILSGVTRPRTFPTEFQAIVPRSCACIGPVAARARPSKKSRKVPPGSLNATIRARCLLLLFVRVFSPLRPFRPFPPLGASLSRAALSSKCHSFPLGVRSLCLLM